MLQVARLLTDHGKVEVLVQHSGNVEAALEQLLAGGVDNSGVGAGGSQLEAAPAVLQQQPQPVTSSHIYHAAGGVRSSSTRLNPGVQALCELHRSLSPRAAEVLLAQVPEEEMQAKFERETSEGEFGTAAPRFGVWD